LRGGGKGEGNATSLVRGRKKRKPVRRGGGEGFVLSGKASLNNKKGREGEGITKTPRKELNRRKRGRVVSPDEGPRPEKMNQRKVKSPMTKRLFEGGAGMEATRDEAMEQGGKERKVGGRHHHHGGQGVKCEIKKSKMQEKSAATKKFKKRRNVQSRGRPSRKKGKGRRTNQSPIKRGRGRR